MALTAADKAYIRRAVTEVVHEALRQFGAELSAVLSAEQDIQHIGGTTAATPVHEAWLFEEEARFVPRPAHLAKRFRPPPVVGF